MSNGFYTLTYSGLKVNKPTNVKFTFGNQGMRLYVDGKVVQQNGYKGGLAGNMEPLVIGANQWSSSAGKANKIETPFKGTLTNVVLSGDVTQQPAPPPEPIPGPEPQPIPEPQPTPTPPPSETGRVTLKAKDGLPNIPGYKEYTKVAKGNIGQWGDGVTLRGYGFDGKPAHVVYDTKFKRDDHGFGVISPGDRWPQIDYL